MLYEYDSLLRYQKDYSIGASPCNYVTASPNGTVYAASGREVYQKKEGDSSFRKAITESAEINGLTVGIGGQVLYVLSGSEISAYTESGEPVAFLETGLDVKGFSVDYRGDVYVVSGKKLYKYERRLEGYAAPATFDLPAAYASFSDVALGENGALYLIADHNVLIFEKEVFSVYTKEDAAFNDNEPSVHPRFVAEVTKDAAIAYVSPGNFEDISIIPKGKKLMCYATVLYQDAPYVRIETEKGTLYLAKSDVNVFEEGKAPFRQARCLLPAIGENVVGVNIYKEPSFIEIEKGTEPLFSSLGKEEVFEVLSVVAADEAGKDVWGFYRVSYQGTEGYVLADEVVSPDADPPPMPKTYEVQVKSDGLGKTVSVYSEEDKNSIVVGTLSDGTKIKALEPIDREKEFIKVLYQGEVCYVLSANLSQGGLTGGQVLAIVLSVVAAVGSVLTILILRASKKHKRNQ